MKVNTLDVNLNGYFSLFLILRNKVNIYLLYVPCNIFNLFLCIMADRYSDFIVFYSLYLPKMVKMLVTILNKLI